MIRDHVWRPNTNRRGRFDPLCGYMNCRKSRAEHERAIAGCPS